LSNVNVVDIKIVYLNSHYKYKEYFRKVY